MNQATKISISIAILAVIATGVWYARKGAPEAPPADGGTDVVVDNAGGSVADGGVDTSGWKIYQNEKYGFEFKYPNEWFLVDCSHTTSDNVRVAVNDLEISCHEKGGRINVTTYGPDYFNQNYEKYSISRYTPIGKRSFPQIEAGHEITGSEGEKIATEPMQKIILTYIPYENEDLVVSYNQIISLEEGEPSESYTLAVQDDYTDVYNLILSTFTFIEDPVVVEDTTPDISKYDFSGWRTYRSQEEGFSFQYPPNFYRGTISNPGRFFATNGPILTSFSAGEEQEFIVAIDAPLHGKYYYHDNYLDVHHAIAFSYDVPTGQWNRSHPIMLSDSRKIHTLDVNPALKTYSYSSGFGDTKVQAAFINHPQKDERYIIELYDSTGKTPDVSQIVSSFTFENPNENPISWDVYKSEEMRLTFEFPTIEGIMTEGYTHWTSAGVQTGVLFRWNLIPAYDYPVGSASNNFTTHLNEEVVHTVKFVKEDGALFLERPVINREPTPEAVTNLVEVDPIKTLTSANGLDAIIYDAQKTLGRVIPNDAQGKITDHLAATVNFPQYYHPHIESITFYFAEPTDVKDIEWVINSLKLNQQ